MNHLMLDLETLGNNSRSPISAIGAVLFDPQAGIVDETFYRVIDIACYDQYKDYFTIDYSTVRWWMEQSDAAIKSTFVSQDKVPLDAALEAFQQFVPSRNGTKIWGNGADFDNVILGAAYDALSMNKPWKYSNNRCFRTVKDLVGITIPYVKTGTVHNALDDAKNQANFLIEAFKVIIIGGSSGNGNQ